MVFEVVTKEWSNAKTKRRRRRTKEQILADARLESERIASEQN